MDVREYWDGRAQLGERAGTDDLMLHRLEVEAIAKYIRDGMTVLDVGCGNGLTAIQLAKSLNIEIYGIDYSQVMIDEATRFWGQHANLLKGFGAFAVRDVLELSAARSYEWLRFDLIYTQRCLVNLPDWEAQQQAIKNILALLKPGGTYLMVESSQDGLNRLNELRRAVGLSEINAPWHNRYIREEEINRAIKNEEFGPVECVVIPFTATYYFLSRVVNAWLAAQEGKEPSYDAPINQLALNLPAIGDCAQTKMWIWRKAI